MSMLYHLPPRGDVCGSMNKFSEVFFILPLYKSQVNTFLDWPNDAIIAYSLVDICQKLNFIPLPDTPLCEVTE